MEERYDFHARQELQASPVGAQASIGDQAAPLIFIAGFMGTGKTETGRALSELLSLDFVDMDYLIEGREGMTVADIFARHGEAYFRAREEEVCRELAQRSGLVVATGGGALVNESNYSVLSSAGRLILLEASVEAIAERIGSDASRPLILGARSFPPDGERSRLSDQIRQLLKAREPVYHRITTRIDTTELTPRAAAYGIASLIDIPSRTITLRVPASSARPLRGITSAADEGFSDPATTDIEIGRGVLSKLGEWLTAHGLNSKAFILIARNVRDLFLDQLAASLDAARIPWRDIAIDDGDAEKNLQQVGHIVDQLAACGAQRDSVAIAVGGGVTGDLVGFAASIYMRGIPLVQIPTTLLAQVDSSIGGKVGANLPRAKNLVGSFYHPQFVLSDPSALRTLPAREVSNGMAEVVKTAILGSLELFDFLWSELSEDPDRKLRDTDFLERCVVDCAAIKASIVERDPFEEGERRVLNLGHTVGHALEAVSGYRELTHGQAVSIGTVVAMRIADRRGLLSPGLLQRTREILDRCGLPVSPPAFDESHFLKSLNLDKKKRAGRLCFVLPSRPGRIIVVDDVTAEEILAGGDLDRC